MNGYLGIVDDLLKGKCENLSTGDKITLPINEIVIEENILNTNFQFAERLLNKKNILLSGKNSYDIFGDKVKRSLEKHNINFDIKILDNYETTREFASKLTDKLKEYENIISLGSGSIIDISKFISSANDQNLIVFCSSLSAAATTSTVSLFNNGIKESVNAKIPKAIVIDLQNLKIAPPRLLRSALGDVLCRSTCQVDWLASNLFLNTNYDETPFALQYSDEQHLIKNSKKIMLGDYETLASLSRMTLLNGIAAIIIGTTHAGSMGEHLISHYIDMFMGESHPGTLHGEQVGVATLLVSEIQNDIINNFKTLKFSPIQIDKKNFEHLFSIDDMSFKMFEQFKNKYFFGEKLENINDKLNKNWTNYRNILRKYLIPTQSIKIALEECGAIIDNRGLKIPDEFYNEAINNSFLLRDRFSFIDIAHYTKTIQNYQK